MKKSKKKKGKETKKQAVGPVQSKIRLPSVSLAPVEASLETIATRNTQTRDTEKKKKKKKKGKKKNQNKTQNKSHAPGPNFGEEL
jgi:hypothetical protein